MMQRNKQAGFGILMVELLIVMACGAIALTGTLVGVVQISKVRNTQAAYDRTRQVALAEFDVAHCSIPSNNCNAMPLAPTIPQPGTITLGGYNYQLTQVDATTWTYQAWPVSPVTGQTSFYISNDNVMRCDATGAQANAGSPVCQ